MRLATLTLIVATVSALACGAQTKPRVRTVLHISSHLARKAQVAVDGGRAVTAPGEGSTVVAITAGRHVLKVTTASGAVYQADLNLKPETLMTWKGKGYWCVNLLERSVEVYSIENCEEDVTDAG